MAPAPKCHGGAPHVLLHPLRTDCSYLIERPEDIRIEHFRSHRPIEPFNAGILIGLARLNKPERDPTSRTPGRKAIGEEFWAIVEPNGLRLATPGRHLLQHQNHLRAGPGMCANSFVSNVTLITKVYFSRVIIPASVALSGIVDFVIAAVLIGGFMIY